MLQAITLGPCKLQAKGGPMRGREAPKNTHSQATELGPKNPKKRAQNKAKHSANKGQKFKRNPTTKPTSWIQ